MTQELIAILGVAGLLLSTMLSFVLGKRWERNRQSLLIRAQMLEPIKDWLRGAERFIGILSDTLGSVVSGRPGPMTYDLEERRKSAQFMIENTNQLLGILDSESLVTRRTRKDAHALASLLRALDNDIKYVLLPLDHELLDRSLRHILDEGFIKKVGETKLRLEKDVQTAYSLVARVAARLA
jgi:hypothetical protein